jgi:hypothetical protein
MRERPSKGRRDYKKVIFTLKHPHNFPARKFALKAEMKDQAISCWRDCRPNFHDISVAGTLRVNFTFCGFGQIYTNGTGMDGKMSFSCSEDCQAKQIALFEIAFSECIQMTMSETCKTIFEPCSPIRGRVLESSHAL